MKEKVAKLFYPNFIKLIYWKRETMGVCLTPSSTRNTRYLDVCIKMIILIMITLDDITLAQEPRSLRMVVVLLRMLYVSCSSENAGYHYFQ